ncbi:hypothetical protein SAMD00019534_053480 [Acytostelium subglobosum LB1]|uniref:hypothetical protein n=1 Tax=Acytostelium subglobosum LB1 TaxID=1410327 RepID=UPI000644FFBA|nr:hypothetical protein SAMD00019534_053480 [Acytostelium subglobosum LB1]GAM22173.1 hypothetical protein SAMD00019534_053480 [Acytostelium subglobosum LB1]|eukprot:XP_012755273.1 hypothetical protein SAMD00019534_053480 [Acytostelium subglobosum LB1]
MKRAKTKSPMVNTRSAGGGGRNGTTTTTTNNRGGASHRKEESDEEMDTSGAEELGDDMPLSSITRRGSKPSSPLSSPSPVLVAQQKRRVVQQNAATQSSSNNTMLMTRAKAKQQQQQQQQQQKKKPPPLPTRRGVKRLADSSEDEQSDSVNNDEMIIMSDSDDNMSPDEEEEESEGVEVLSSEEEERQPKKKVAPPQSKRQTNGSKKAPPKRPTRRVSSSSSESDYMSPESDSDYEPPAAKPKRKAAVAALATTKRKMPPRSKLATTRRTKKSKKEYSSEDEDYEEEEDEDESMESDDQVSAQDDDDEDEDDEEEGDEEASEEELSDIVISLTADEADLPPDQQKVVDDIVDLSKEVVDKILTSKLFKGKFMSLPYTLYDYQNKANNSSRANVSHTKSDNGTTTTSTTTTTATSTSSASSSPMIKSESKDIVDSTSPASVPAPASLSTEHTTNGTQSPLPQNEATKVDHTPMQQIAKTEETTTTTTSTSNTTTTTTDTEASKKDEPMKDEEVRYLVTLKDRSFRSVRWMTIKDLESTHSTDHRLSVKIKKANMSPAEPIKDEAEANPLHYFSPDHIQIDKVLTEEQKTFRQRGKRAITLTRYLVKWKNLPHEKSTWEFKATLRSPQDLAAIQTYFEMINTGGGTKKYVSRPTKLPSFDPDLVPLFKSGLALKEFQVEGFLWLSYCWYHERSSLLADEMGLGKTIQTISFLQFLSQRVGVKGPFLVVAPLSTLGNWHKEIIKWTDMRVLMFYGIQETRTYLKKYEWRRKDKTYMFEILLTTYETVMTEHADIVKVPWRVIVLDEGHRIKNVNSKVLTKLKSIRTEHSVILTGTPLQNDMKELWTMLNFLDPKKFNNCTEFLDEFSDLKEEVQVNRLHQLLSPYLLRRMKEDVELSIPIKEETVIQVELSSIQKTYYRAILEKNREFLSRGIRSKSNLPKLTNIMIQIRKVCNHPFLIPGAEDTIVKQEKLTTDEQIYELMIRSSSKLVLVDKLLLRLKAEGHKVLIFSQMVESLNILEDYLHYRQYPYERLDGSVKSEDRQASIERFMEKESDRFVFLLSTRSGGVGINLTSADTVILFDSDWNPQSDLQAQARCHRIGQTSNVKVYRLITRNTYEEYLFEVATKKLLLDHIVLNQAKNNPIKDNAAAAAAAAAASLANATAAESGTIDVDSDPTTTTTTTTTTSTTDGTSTTTPPQGGAAAGKDIDPEAPSEISQMLKYGAAYLFAESANDASELDKIMFNEDIDKILERSTTISFDTKNKPTNLSGFSKATFASNENDMDVDIDDENFWEKVLPEYKTVRQLDEKLTSGSIFASEEARAKYIDDICTLAQNKRDELNDSINVEFIGDLLKLIMRVEFNTRFSTEERDRVQNMRILLERPRTRKRVVPEVVQTAPADKKKKNIQAIITMPDTDSSSDDDGGSDPDFVDPDHSHDSDDSQSEAPKGKSSKNKNPLAASGQGFAVGTASSVPVWSKSNKDKLKAILTKYGMHRWHKVQKELMAAGSINKSPAEIQSIAESFLVVGYGFQDAMKSYFDSFVEDTSNYNWHRMGFNYDNYIGSVNNLTSLKQFVIKDVNSNIPLITTQATVIRWEVVQPPPPAQQQAALPPSPQQDIVVGSTSPPQTTSTTDTSMSTATDTAIANSTTSNNNVNMFEQQHHELMDHKTYYLVLMVEEFNNLIIRSYPIVDGQTSLEMFFPGFNGTYIAKIIYANPQENTYQLCSNEMRIATTPSIIWQQLDFPSFATRVQSTLTRLVQMSAIKQFVTRHGKDLRTLKIPSLGRGPTLLWTTEHDRALLIGVYRHGFGKFIEILQDPGLDFQQAFKKKETNTLAFQSPGSVPTSDDTVATDEKTPSSETIRRRLARITDLIIKNAHHTHKSSSKSHKSSSKHRSPSLTYTPTTTTTTTTNHHDIDQDGRIFSPEPVDASDEDTPSYDMPITSNKNAKNLAKQKLQQLQYSLQQQQAQFKQQARASQQQHQQQQQQQQQQHLQKANNDYKSFGKASTQAPSSSAATMIINFRWENKVYQINVPHSVHLDILKKMFIVKFNLYNVVGHGEDRDSVLRFYHNKQVIQPGVRILDLGITDGDIIDVTWESKWKTVQVKGFDHGTVLMKVQDDTVLEDIVKAYFHQSQPPYDLKNLRVETRGQTFDLKTDIGFNGIKDEEFLHIVPSPEIIHVNVIPSWGGEKEVYALHKRNTLLCKLTDSFLKKHNIQSKQVLFTFGTQHIDPAKCPTDQGIENESHIYVHLLLVRLDVSYKDTTVPYLLSTTTSFDSMMQRFCERLQLYKPDTVFYFEGKPLNPEDSPERINMKTQASIVVATATASPKSAIEVEVRLVGQDSGSYIKMHTANPFPLQILMDKFCQEHHLSSSVIFKHNGKTIDGNDTLLTIGLKDADVIECYLVSP